MPTARPSHWRGQPGRRWCRGGRGGKTGGSVSGEEFRVLAEEQAALRRVATRVARAVAPEEVLAAVTEEVRQLLSV
jgi:hypothetical protein